MEPLGGRRAIGPARPDLTSYEGLWVAIVDGEIIEAGETSHQLALRLRSRADRRGDQASTAWVCGAAARFWRETGDLSAQVLREMDHRKRQGAVIEYVRPTVDSYIVGAG